MSKVKVLFFAADPLSASQDGRHPRLLLDEDVRQVLEKVRAAEHRDALGFDFRLAARPDDLIQALSETRPQVVHFSGHGDRGGLVLASADGKRPHPVGAATLARLFETFRGDIRVVVLNACLSLPQAEAIAAVVGCAIGTRAPISDRAAITFAASFYRALAFGQSVRAAYDQARTALALAHVEACECPELVVRPGVDPASLVLVSAGGPETARPALAARARRWAGTAAVAAALASGIAFLDPDPNRREALGIAGGLSKCSPGSVAGHSRGPAAAPGGPSPEGTALAAAKDLHAAGNFAAALPLFHCAAEAGDTEAMGFLGVMYLNGEGTRPEPALAIHWLRESGEKRDARGMNGLGSAYERGLGVTRSARWAMHWYRAAAEEKTYVPAMRNLARMYLKVKASPREALAWYRRAADAGSVDALVDAGEIHQTGPAEVRDPKEALRLYRAAAERKSARGMVAIGRMYQQGGQGVPRDYAEARSWYEKGADAGSAAAMNNLGVLYQKGWGVEANRAEALRWFRRAAEAGSTVAAANLDAP